MDFNPDKPKKGKGKKVGKKGKKKVGYKNEHLKNKRVSMAFLKQSTTFHDGRKDVAKFGAGDSYYVADFLKAEAKELFTAIVEEVKFNQMFHIGDKEATPIPRLVAAQSERKSDGAAAIYRMPGCNEKNIPTSQWTPKVGYVVEKASECIKQTLNHCVVSRFRTQDDSLAFHHDKILDLADKSLILSVSFGEARPIIFYSLDGRDRQTLVLQPGSLLAIGPQTNRQFLHAIPKLEDQVGERISLSIRTIETFIKFDDKKEDGKAVSSSFVVTGKGAEFQTANYPFSKSHDDPTKYSDEVKRQIKESTDKALGAGVATCMCTDPQCCKNKDASACVPLKQNPDAQPKDKTRMSRLPEELKGV